MSPHPRIRISFLGSSLVSAYWNGAATYYRGLLRALHDLGATITFYEPDAYSRQEHRDLPEPPWAMVRVYPAQQEAAIRAAQEASAADLVVKASGVGIFDELLEAAVLQFRRSGSRVAFWDVDAPATLDRIRNNPADPFVALIPQYDYIFTYGGGDPVVSAYKNAGARVCVPIYNALDPETHGPAASDARFESDLAFLGNRLPDREARVDEFFFTAAELMPDRKLLLGGSGWDDRRMPANVRYAGHIYTTEHNAFNCTPTAVLNISRESMARYGFSPATRVFEAAGAGACIITDAWVGIEQFLEPGNEILVANNGGEVAEHLGRLSRSDASRIGDAARRRVLAEHTYAHRAVQVMEVLGERVSIPGGSETRAASAESIKGGWRSNA